MSRWEPALLHYAASDRVLRFHDTELDTHTHDTTGTTDDDDDDDGYTDRQLIVLGVTTRVAATVSLVCAMLMARTAWRIIGNARRSGGDASSTGSATTSRSASNSIMYHRFILAMSLHLVLFSVCHMVGSWAIPKDTAYTWNPMGTTATCTAQGFLLQVTVFSVISYYVALSVYSHCSVLHNFVTAKYAWVEKWIHLIVHIFPLVSAAYLAQQQAFNATDNAAACWIESLPRHCGDVPRHEGDEIIPCTRGPDNISTLSTWLGGAPVSAALILPTALMISLYYRVRARQSKVSLPARLVAWQASYYLCALYACFTAAVISNAMFYWHNTTSYTLHVLNVVCINLLGLSMWAIYRYFTYQQQEVKPHVSQMVKCRDGEMNTKSQHTRTTGEEEEESLERHSDTQRESSTSPKYTFNIFDGSNPTTEFADHVFDGDSEDEALDRMESVRWEDIQDHV